MIPVSPGELDVYAAVIRIFAGIWAVVSATEWLAARGVFADDGLLAWRIMKIRPGRAYASETVRRLYSARFVTMILWCRLLAGATLIILGSLPATIAALVVLIGTAFYMGARASVGGDGSDQMGLLLAIGLLILNAGRGLSDDGIIFAGVLLIGGQAVLSYFVSGISKLISRTWRSGMAIIGVMGTHTYGHDFAASLVGRSRTAARLVCWGIILTEMAFPLVLFVPLPLVYLGLLAAALFHFSNALFMGLNTFVPTFIGTYPAVILLNLIVRQALHLTT